MCDRTARREALAVSPAEAAELVGISRSRLYQLMAEGVIPSIRLGGRRLIRVAALSEFLIALEQGHHAMGEGAPPSGTPGAR